MRTVITAFLIAGAVISSTTAAQAQATPPQPAVMPAIVSNPVAHIADINYIFCAEASGDSSPPVQHIEQRLNTKADIDRALQESFDY